MSIPGDKGPQAKGVSGGMSLGWAVSLGLSLLFFAYVFLLTLIPLTDPDLWWHLTTGRWMVEHGSLMGHVEPFAYTSPARLTDVQVTALRGQWLGQIVLYLVSLAGGLGAVAYLRGFMIVAPFVYLYARHVREGTHPLLALSVLSFSPLFIVLSMPYTFERPQAFSFVLALVVVLLLMKEAGHGAGGAGGAGGKASPSLATAVALLLVMALWSNLHGGYIVGAALIVIFIASEVVKKAIARVKGRQAGSLRPIVVGLASIAATGANPNGYRMLYDQGLGGVLGMLGVGAASDAGGAGGASGMGMRIIEFQSVWFLYKTLHTDWFIYLIAFIVVAALWVALGAVYKRKSAWGLDLTPVVLSLAVAFLGLYHVRGIGFALVILPAFVLLTLKGRGKGRAGWAAGVVFCLLTLLLLQDFVKATPWHFRPRVPNSWVGVSAVPERSISFIEENNIQGPMYNYLAWGGYFIWRTYPRRQVFIDGRLLSTPVSTTAHHILNAGPGWQGMLDKYGVNFMAVPVISRSDLLPIPLVMRIAAESPRQWKLVYLWANEAVFVRDNEKNREVIDRHGKENRAIYGEVINVAGEFLITTPGHPVLLFAQAYSLYHLARYDEAEQLALAILSDVPEAARLLREIEKKKR